MSKEILSILLALNSAFFLALYLIYQKKSIENQSPAAFTFTSSLLVSVPFFAMVLFLDLPNFKILALLFVKSSITAGQYLMVAEANKRLPISYLSPTKALTPIFILFISFFILHERVSIFEIFGVLLIIIGMVSLQMNYKWQKSKILITTFFIFIILPRILSATIDTFNKIVFNDVGVSLFMSIYAWDKIFLTVSSLIVLLANKESIKNALRSINSWTVRSSVAFFINDLSFLLALNSAKLLVTAIIRRTDVLFATVIGGKLFKEKNILKNLLSAVIMILGASIIILW